LIPEDYLIWNISIKIHPENVQGTLAYIKNKWQAHAPGNPFRFEFLDEMYNRMYIREDKLKEIFGYFTLLAISIACLGLFGLASFSTEQRTKEIGIRRVLGANVTRIVWLLSREFTKWVILANILAWPIAYYALNRWLHNFAYRINIEFWYFFLAAFLALAVAAFTVSFQSVKAAVANPVDALRYE
jgi:putative ABC transport system permease protein